MYIPRITAALMTCLACLVFCPVPGLAQYWMSTEPGYTLQPVSDSLAALVAKQSPLSKVAQEASGMDLFALFTVQPGMSRYYVDEYDQDTGEYGYMEFEVVPSADAPGLEMELTEYKVDGQPLMIGLGLQAEEEDWAPAQVVSLIEQSDGTVRELDRWELGAQYCYGIYAMDLLGDGSLCLVAPWMTGAGGGGGVDVLWLAPDGTFKQFGPDETYASIWSQNGYVSLVDFDGDGTWELETAFPMMYTVSGYSYKELLYFNRESWSWLGGEGRFPEFYAPQNEFYSILFAKARDMQQDTSKYKVDDPSWEGEYGFKLDGEWYSLEPFVNWETGEFDPMWLENWADTFGE